jgi:preprotein translocase subunit SecA
MLPIIDRLWVDHLYIMDTLKTGIGLRGYGQKDPRVEYEKEAYEIFEDLKNNIADEAIKMVFYIVIQHTEPGTEPGFGVEGGPTGTFETVPDGSLAPHTNGEAAPLQESRLDPAFTQQLLGPPPKPKALHTNREDDEPKKPVKADSKVGRNELCPCGSGKKFKRCHGVTA